MHVILGIVVRHSRHLSEAVAGETRDTGDKYCKQQKRSGDKKSELVGGSKTIKQEAGTTPRNPSGTAPVVISSSQRS